MLGPCLSHGFYDKSNFNNNIFLSYTPQLSQKAMGACDSVPMYKDPSLVLAWSNRIKAVDNSWDTSLLK